MFGRKIVCPRYLLRFFGPEYLAHLVNSSHRFFVQSSIFELTQKNELRRRGVSSGHRALQLPWFPASGCDPVAAVSMKICEVCNYSNPNSSHFAYLKNAEGQYDFANLADTDLLKALNKEAEENITSPIKNTLLKYVERRPDLQRPLLLSTPGLQEAIECFQEEGSGNI